MSETVGQQMGRNLRPQASSTRGLRQNQNSGGNNMNVAQDPLQLLNGLVAQYTQGFNNQSAMGSSRLRGEIERDLVARGLGRDASGVDILARGLGDYQSQSNAAFATGVIPLYTAMASLAQNAMEAEAGRQFQFDYLGRQQDYNLDVLGRQQEYGRSMQDDEQAYGLDYLGRQQNWQEDFARQQINNQLDYQKRMTPINSEAYRTAWNLEQSLNSSAPVQANPYMSAVNAMATSAALSKPLQIGSLEPTPQQSGPMVGGGYDRMNPPPNGWIPTPTDYGTFDLTPLP